MTYICCIEILFRCLRKKKSGSHKTKKATEPLKPLSLSLLKVGETRPPSLSFSPLASGLQQHTHRNTKKPTNRERDIDIDIDIERDREREREISLALSLTSMQTLRCAIVSTFIPPTYLNSHAQFNSLTQALSLHSHGGFTRRVCVGVLEEKWVFRGRDSSQSGYDRKG